jgi:hypothetical protein
MKKQTAVEWLVEQYARAFKIPVNAVMQETIHQALAMEKEQIVDAFGVGCQVESTRLIGYHEMAEQYYNETYTDTP